MDRILILAERDGDNDALADTLRSHGFDASVRDSADAVRSELRSTSIDLVIIDLDLRALRGARGLELAREVRSAYPATRVMLTSTSCLTERQLERTDCGAVAFLPKPYDLDRAPGLVHRCLSCCCEQLRRLWHAQGAAPAPSSYAL